MSGLSMVRVFDRMGSRGCQGDLETFVLASDRAFLNLIPTEVEALGRYTKTI
jgi:hypothetical protein